MSFKEWNVHLWPMNNNSFFKYLSLTTVWSWLSVFVLVPTLFLLIVSFLNHDITRLFRLPFTLENYIELFNPIYPKILLKSLYIAAGTTLCCLLIGYPFAYCIAKSKSQYKAILLLFVIIPFWTSSLIRTYAIVVILKAQGFLNTFLLWTGIIHQPLQILYSNLAVFIGLTYDFLPFMILPLYANIEKLDDTLIEAARDLGAKTPRIFLKIIFPLTMPGIMAGVMLVFLPSITMFYIPDLLGGAKSMLLGNLIQTQFLFISNWPLGSATSIGLIILLCLMLWIHRRATKGQEQELL